MSDETPSIDPGLDELVSDVLGPRADASADAATSGAEPSADPVARDSASEQAPTPPPATPTPQATTPADPAASAPAPTPPETIELDFGDGRGKQRLTVDQVVKTLQQFPHLQQKYVEAKQRADAYERQQAEIAAKQTVDPRNVLAAVRQSFDPGVRESISQGFMEEEFGQLYPNLAASMIMHRDLVAALIGRVNAVQGKVSEYESQYEGQRVRAEIENNMVALSGTHPAYAGLADPKVRENFYAFVWDLNPTEQQFRNPRYIAQAWAAYNEPRFLESFTAPQAPTAQPTADPAARKRARAFASGDASNARPSAPPPAQPKDGAAGDDMFDEVLQGTLNRK